MGEAADHVAQTEGGNIRISVADGENCLGGGKLAKRVGSRGEGHVVHGVEEGIPTKGESVAIKDRLAGSLALLLRARRSEREEGGNF